MKTEKETLGGMDMLVATVVSERFHSTCTIHTLPMHAWGFLRGGHARGIVAGADFYVLMKKRAPDIVVHVRGRSTIERSDL